MPEISCGGEPLPEAPKLLVLAGVCILYIDLPSLHQLKELNDGTCFKMFTILPRVENDQCQKLTVVGHPCQKPPNCWLRHGHTLSRLHQLKELKDGTCLKMFTILPRMETDQCQKFPVVGHPCQKPPNCWLRHRHTLTSLHQLKELKERHCGTQDTPGRSWWHMGHSWKVVVAHGALLVGRGGTWVTPGRSCQYMGNSW